jgi:hypothetical protein
MGSKPTPQRLFTGLSGSSFSRINTAVKAQKPNWTQLSKDPKALSDFLQTPSNHTLRETLSPDREQPIASEDWIDEFGDHLRGGRDLDACFQSVAFDRYLNPRVTSAESENDTGSSPAGTNPESVRVIGDFGGDSALTREVTPRGFQTGCLPGGRKRRRRPSERTWWIFEADLLRAFIQQIAEKSRIDAENTAVALVGFYLQNLEDADVFEDTSRFRDLKSLKNFRQRTVAKGFERFGPRPPMHIRDWGRRGRIRGKRCDEPTCVQCASNDTTVDYTE